MPHITPGNTKLPHLKKIQLPVRLQNWLRTLVYEYSEKNGISMGEMVAIALIEKYGFKEHE